MEKDVLGITIDQKRNSLEFEVFGKYALFSDPVTRVGGEKCSYQVPTYQALKGIVESVYWKPTLIWTVDAVRVMNKIQTESKGIRPIKLSGGNELAYYTYLKDVRYQVLAHFTWNENRPNLIADRNEHKHHNIAKSSLAKGGKRDIFLGTRDCQGYVVPCEFGAGEGFYDAYDGELDFGFLFHGFDYPDETGREELGVRFGHCVMRNGIIVFPAPTDETLLRRVVREHVTMKEFGLGKNVESVETDRTEV